MAPAFSDFSQVAYQQQSRRARRRGPGRAGAERRSML